MRTCEICGKTKEDTSSMSVYTARSLGQSKVKFGFKQYTVTTQFGDFKEHSYQVCSACKNRASCLVPTIVYFVSAIVFVFLFGIVNSSSFWNALLYIGGGSFCRIFTIRGGYNFPEY